MSLVGRLETLEDRLVPQSGLLCGSLIGEDLGVGTLAGLGEGGFVGMDCSL